MNTRFHEMIAGFSGNRFILQSIEQMDRLRKFQEFATFKGSSRALLQSCKEHIEILDAIEGGDRAWASALMRRHLQEGAERVLASGLAAGTVFESRKAPA